MSRAFGCNHKNIYIATRLNKAKVNIKAVGKSQADSEVTKKLVQIIEDMPKSPDGSRKLKMLGLDGWKKIGEAETAILER